MCGLFIFCVGLIVFPPHLANGHGHHVAHLKPQNASDAAAQQRMFTVTEALEIGNVLISVWSSVLSDRAVEIEISNRMTTSLKYPSWYMLHGYAGVLPPYLIKENEPSTKIQFYRKPGSFYGTEGAASYQFITSQGTISLVFMWKVPQLLSMGFYVTVKKREFLTGKNLESLFENANSNDLWFSPAKSKRWQTGSQLGVTWKAAMGTKSLTTLRIAVM